jgi:hypothetical protein
MRASVAPSARRRWLRIPNDALREPHAISLGGSNSGHDGLARALLLL